jgi:integrase/type IV secretory pathway VirB2 component (pilin)
MLLPPRYPIPFPRASISATVRMRRTFTLVTLFLIVPAVSFAQAGGTPFDTGFTAIQTLFTGTIAKVASLVAIVIGGYAFAHGEPGAKKTLAGVAAGSGITVMTVNDWFVENRYFPMREGRWRPATKKTTEFEIRLYLVSPLGSKPMRILNTFELQVVLNKLAQTYSDSVVQHAYVNLKSILKTARKLKFVPEDPGEDLTMPDTKTVEKPTLSMEQIVALVSAVTDPHDLCLPCIGIFCGTRTSEALGLQWKSWQGDYLLPFGTAHEGQFFAGKLKTGASRDAIPVPEPIRKVIAAWQRHCEDPSPEAFMFATFGRGKRTGSDVPRHGKNFLRWRIHPIAEKLEISTRLITFQVMRRTLGTDLQKYGTLKEAQRILRHADIKTTGNVYMQAIPESVMKAINKRTRAVLKGQVIEGKSVTVPNGSQLRLKESVSC